MCGLISETGMHFPEVTRMLVDYNVQNPYFYGCRNFDETYALIRVNACHFEVTIFFVRQTSSFAFWNRNVNFDIAISLYVVIIDALI